MWIGKVKGISLSQTKMECFLLSRKRENPNLEKHVDSTEMVHTSPQGGWNINGTYVSGYKADKFIFALQNTNMQSNSIELQQNPELILIHLLLQVVL